MLQNFVTGERLIRGSLDFWGNPSWSIYKCGSPDIMGDRVEKCKACKLRISTKRHGYDVYTFFKRNGLINENVQQLLDRINGKTMREAAFNLNADVRTLLTLLRYLLKTGVIKEVKIK